MSGSVTADAVRGVEDETFVSLIASHQLVLTGFLRTMLRRSADVDDVLQETNLVLWRKRQEYHADRPFAPWACKIAHFQALSYLKARESRSPQLLEQAALGQLAELSMKHVNQIDQQLEEMQRCLRKLSRPHRQLVQARYLESLSVSQIAENVGKTPHAISMILYRLRNILRECVERSLRSEVIR